MGLAFQPEQIALLQDIRNRAETLKNHVRENSSNPRKPCIQLDPNFSIPTLSLPLPSEILPSFSNLGLPNCIADEISNTVFRWINRLRDTHSKGYERACHQIISSSQGVNISLLERTRLLFHQSFERRRDHWINNHLLDLISSHCRTYNYKPQSSKRQRSFNAEYVPLLEKYFEYNAYPSALDRKVLAHKSMMEPRQIEVWFQNHRNRGKKDGKYLRKLSCNPLPLKFCLASLESKMPLFAIDASERRTVESHNVADEKCADSDITPLAAMCRAPLHDDVLNPPPPPHAFPAVYRPSTTYRPFPVQHGISAFPAPAWSRKPVTQRKTLNTVFDFDDFVAQFANMNLRQQSARPTKHKLLKATGSWFASTVVVPFPAPHPALIRRSPSTSTPSALGTSPRKTSATSTDIVDGSHGLSTFWHSTTEFNPFASSTQFPTSRPSNTTSRASSYSSIPSLDGDSSPSPAPSSHLATPRSSPAPANSVQLPSIFQPNCSQIEWSPSHGSSTNRLSSSAFDKIFLDPLQTVFTPPYLC